MADDQHVSSDSDVDGAENISEDEIEDHDDSQSSEEETNDRGSDPGDRSPVKKKGLADAMAKILNKQVPVHKQVILAKGKTDKEIEKRKIKTEANDTDDVENQSFSLAAHEKKKLWEEMGRVRPNPLERDAERKLQRIAQRGVVQLFNAVRSQQKVIDEKLKAAGPTECKQAKVMENMTKGKFLDLLKGTQVSVALEPKTEPVQIKEEKIDEEAEKKWNILRDDFMMGAKMKDWDKDDSDSDSNQNDQQNSKVIEDSSDSDNG